MRRVGKVVKIIIFVLVALAVFGFVVMRLWNWLMPELFGLHLITYWQSLGVVILSKILFGGFRGGRPMGPWRHRMMERWEKMTPEEREKFRQGMRGRCGGPFSQPPAETKT